ncbi:hypothetical protein LL946_10735 [Knoellia locipacati]
MGLAAASHAHHRGLEAIMLEAGPAAGASVREWGHVRLFSPWSELIDPIADKLLTEGGWVSPSPSSYPTGAEWVRSYLHPSHSFLRRQKWFQCGSTIGSPG